MNILQKLVTIIQNSINTTVSIPAYINYFLGENIEEDSMSDSAFYDLYSGRSHLSDSNRKKLLSSNDWSINRLKRCLTDSLYSIYIDDIHFDDIYINETQISNELRKLITENKITTNSDISSMVKSLVLLHFFGQTDNIALLFPRFLKHPCKDYISWPETEHRILDLLYKKQLIFIVGKPASGKKQLLLHLLQDDPSSPYRDIFWIDYSSCKLPIEERICTIRFPYSSTKNWNISSVLNLLKQKPSTSILIIDMPSTTCDDLNFIHTYLSNLKMKVVITTRCHDIPKNFNTINIDERPKENLINIFHIINSSTDLSDSDLEKLISIIDNNPYIMSLIAKSLMISKKPIDRFLDHEKWIWYDKGLPKLHSLYHDPEKKYAQNTLNLICRIVPDYPDIVLNSISELSIWAKTPLERSLLVKHFGSQTISECISYGILLPDDSDSNKLFMPQIFADAVWKRYPIDYNDYKNKIFSFLDKLSSGQPLILPFEDLYQIIYNMIFRFHFQVTTMPSRSNKNVICVFHEWNNILMQLIERYMQFGDYCFAQKVLPHLYMSSTKNGDPIQPTVFQKYVQQLLQSQIDYMESGDFISSIEKIIQILNEWKSNYKLDYINDEACQILYLAQLIIQDLIDHIIIIALKTTADALTSDTDSITLFEHFQKYIVTLITCANYLIANNLIYGYYAMSASNFLSAIFSRYDQLCQINTCPNHQYLGRTLPPELQFKSDCLCFYYRLSLFYTKQFASTEEPNNDIRTFNTFMLEYTALRQYFHVNTWSYSASYLFYACTNLLCACTTLFNSRQPENMKGKMPDILKEDMESYKRFYTRQLSLTSRQIEEFNQYTDFWLSSFFEDQI